jgi:hypothetical protein
MRFRATINVNVVCANATPAAQYYDKGGKSASNVGFAEHTKVRA